MRVRLGGTERGGRALDVEAPLEPVVRAVRDPADDRVVAPTPGPVHEHVGAVTPRTSVERRQLLAAVARSLGHRASQRAEIGQLRSRLEEMPSPSVDLRAARERVADAGTDVERLRERVATLQGRLQALREIGADTTDAAATLRETARELSEAETARSAAVEALSRGRSRAREIRDVREERFVLADRLANLERDARRELAATVRPAVDAAVIAVPGSRASTLEEAGAVTATLAGARVARVEAPVVLACRRFPSAVAASRWLDASVLRVTPEGPPPRAGRGRSSGASPG